MFSITNLGGGTLAPSIHSPMCQAESNTIFILRSAAILGKHMAVGAYVNVWRGNAVREINL
jgi:hypothetical protein